MRLQLIVGLMHAQDGKLVRVPVGQLLKLALSLQGVRRHCPSLQVRPSLAGDMFTRSENMA